MRLPDALGCRLRVSRKSGPESVFFPTTRYPAGRVQKQVNISPSVFFRIQLPNAIRAGRLATGPLVVKIHRRPLYFERWNAAPMQLDAMMVADLEHCRRWLLEGASHCSGYEALVIVLWATDAHFCP